MYMFNSVNVRVKALKYVMCLMLYTVNNVCFELCALTVTHCGVNEETPWYPPPLLPHGGGLGWGWLVELTLSIHSIFYDFTYALLHRVKCNL